MPDHVLLEEFHLTLKVPASMPDAVREAIRRTVNGRDFRASLRRAIVDLLRTTPILERVRVTLST